MAKRIEDLLAFAKTGPNDFGGKGGGQRGDNSIVPSNLKSLVNNRKSPVKPNDPSPRGVANNIPSNNPVPYGNFSGSTTAATSSHAPPPVIGASSTTGTNRGWTPLPPRSTAPPVATLPGQGPPPPAVNLHALPNAQRFGGGKGGRGGGGQYGNPGGPGGNAPQHWNGPTGGRGGGQNQWNGNRRPQPLADQLSSLKDLVNKRQK